MSAGFSAGEQFRRREIIRSLDAELAKAETIAYIPAAILLVAKITRSLLVDYDNRLTALENEVARRFPPVM